MLARSGIGRIDRPSGTAGQRRPVQRADANDLGEGQRRQDEERPAQPRADQRQHRAPNAAAISAPTQIPIHGVTP